MTASIWQDVANAVVTTIQALSLDGITNPEVAVRKKHYTENECHRGVSVCPNEPGKPFGVGVVGANDGYYPMEVVVVRGRPSNFSEPPFQIMQDLTAISNAFHQKRLSGVLSSLICTVTPKAVTFPDKFKKDFDASAVIVNCWTREIR